MIRRHVISVNITIFFLISTNEIFKLVYQRDFALIEWDKNEGDEN